MAAFSFSAICQSRSSAGTNYGSPFTTLASECADPRPFVFTKLTPFRAAENAAFIKDVVSEPFQGKWILTFSVVWLVLTVKQLWLRRTFTAWRSLPTCLAPSLIKEYDYV